MMRSAAIYVGPDFVGDRWQHFRLQLRLNVVNLEYLTIYISVISPYRLGVGLIRYLVISKMADKFEALEQQLELFIENTRQLAIIVGDFQPQGQSVLNQKL